MVISGWEKIEFRPDKNDLLPRLTINVTNYVAFLLKQIT